MTNRDIVLRAWNGGSWESYRPGVVDALRAGRTVPDAWLIERRLARQEGDTA